MQLKQNNLSIYRRLAYARNYYDCVVGVVSLKLHHVDMSKNYYTFLVSHKPRVGVLRLGSVYKHFMFSTKYYYHLFHCLSIIDTTPNTSILCKYKTDESSIYKRINL